MRGRSRKFHRAVNTEVIVQLAAGVEVASIITEESAERLELAEGKKVYRS